MTASCKRSWRAAAAATPNYSSWESQSCLSAAGQNIWGVWCVWLTEHLLSWHTAFGHGRRHLSHYWQESSVISASIHKMEVYHPALWFRQQKHLAQWHTVDRTFLSGLICHPLACLLLQSLAAFPIVAGTETNFHKNCVLLQAILVVMQNIWGQFSFKGTVKNHWISKRPAP